MDTRLQLLTEWVRQHPGLEAANPEPVSGDASFRRYFRVWRTNGGGNPTPLIVMDAPPAHEDCAPFLAIARHWHQNGIAVPAIEAEDLDQGLLMLEDLGDQQMLAELDDRNADPLYHQALDELLLIARQDSPTDYNLPPYDAALLDREMALFPDWLLEQHLGLELGNHDRAMLDTAFGLLKESALAQPVVTVHRDYHSRNLMIRTGDPRPGVIDFQDAVRGPITYDAVSLLKDCYIRWPREQVEQWLEYYRQATVKAGLHRADPETFAQWFDLMGMQRHLKAAGIFARLAIRDGKTGYLQDIPRTIGYLCEASARQPAFRHFHEWLCDTVIPKVEQQIGPLPSGECQPQ